MVAARPTDEVTIERVRAARRALGIERLVLAVHDASFPGGADEDVGRGSPYSRAAARFYELLAGAGFDGIQLGPKGKTSIANPSPYDGSVIAKSPLSIALGPLVDGPGIGGLLPAATLAGAAARCPPEAAHRAQHRRAWEEIERALRTAYGRFTRARGSYRELAQACAAFARDNAEWALADGLYEVLTRVYETDDHLRWSRGGAAALDGRLYAPARGERGRAESRRRALVTEHAELVDYNNFCQTLLDLQHRETRARLGALGLRIYGDLQVGLGHRDVWRYGRLFLDGYVMGAPPSRTNPDGQPWGYPVLDPDLYFAARRTRDARARRRPGPARRFFGRRVERLLGDFDGLRIDHPHGLVCPWIYDAGAPHALEAMRAGARLFSSPDLPDHPRLARFAIARRQDLAPPAAARPRYADDWVRMLSDAQVARYAVLIDDVMEIVRAEGRSRNDVCMEVLSACPYPLARVLERHGLGRLRVVQKANPLDVRDTYRTESARPQDWITLGTHDTPPIWRLAPSWVESGAAPAWAAYLTERLAPPPAERESFQGRLASDPRALVRALFADLFVGPARHVSVFFADFLGLTDVYNTPGTVSDLNWSLRVPPDFDRLYAERRARGDALDVAAALALALRARARGAPGDVADLADALDRGSRRPGR